MKDSYNLIFSEDELLELTVLLQDYYYFKKRIADAGLCQSLLRYDLISSNHTPEERDKLREEMQKVTTAIDAYDENLKYFEQEIQSKFGISIKKE